MGNVLHCHWAVTLSRPCPTIESIQDLNRFEFLARSPTAQCPSLPAFASPHKTRHYQSVLINFDLFWRCSYPAVPGQTLPPPLSLYTWSEPNLSICFLSDVGRMGEQLFTSQCKTEKQSISISTFPSHSLGHNSRSRRSLSYFMMVKIGTEKLRRRRL